MELRSGKQISTFPISGVLGVSENEDVVHNKLHPLAVPEILEHVFGYLHVNHLTSSRLVSQLWNNTAIRSVRRKSEKISFRDKSHVNSFISCFSRSQASTTVNKFKLFFSEIMKHQVVYNRFFKFVAPWMKELSLSFYDDSYNGVTQSKQKWTNQYQSLEKLHVEVFTGPEHKKFTHNRGRKLLRKLLRCVLTSAPELKSVTIICSGHLRDGFVTELLSDGDIVERLKTISCLHLVGCISNLDLENLENSEMKLTELSADVNFNLFPVSNVSLCRFLESQASTLQTLEIKGPIKPDSTTVNFPIFINLRAFKFEGSKYPGLRGNYPSWFPEINFRTQFPSLKKLDISKFRRDEWFHSLERHSDIIENLEELRFRKIENPKKTFQHVVRIFPNLKKLEIPSNPNLTRIAFMAFPNLEELVFRVTHDSMETILTGLSPKKCKTLNKLSNLELENMDISELFSPEQAKPPLSKLTKLRTLRLLPSPKQLPLGIKKVATELVLKRMPSLKTLDFGTRCAPALQEAESSLSMLKESFIVVFD